MSRENVEVVQRGFDAFNRGDLQEMLNHFAPEFELHPSGRWMDTQGVYRGREGWIEFWNTFRAAWESITASVERIEDLGEQVLALGAWQGRGRGSGVETRVEGAWLFTVRAGQVVRIRTFPKWEKALEVAGLRE